MSTAPGFSARLTEIMQRCNVRCTPEEFHNAVNVTFHEHESEEYDQGHRSMWECLPRQFSLLVGDWLESAPPPPQEIHLLDIGCGTGLASYSLRKSPIGDRIRSVTLLDTSPAMLRRAAERVRQWNVPYTCNQGTVQSLDSAQRYDLIAACSLLHHVPDLPGFLGAVRGLQADHGVFLHLQDPNADSLNDPELQNRLARLSTSRPEWLGRLSPKRIVGRAIRELTGKQGKDYIFKTNQALLGQGVISTPLTIPELFSIIDVHAIKGEGISMTKMRAWMSGYDCVSHQSYAFFGKLASELPARYQRIEDDLIERRSLTGSTLAAAWRLHSVVPSI